MKKAKKNEQEKVTVAQANKMMTKGKRVHTFTIMGPMLLGCDMDRKEILAKFEAAGGAVVAGENMTRMDHGLAFFDEKNGWVFVETFKAKKN